MLGAWFTLFLRELRVLFMQTVKQSSVTIEQALGLRWSAETLLECDQADAAWHSHYRAIALRKLWPWQRWFLRREPNPQELEHDIRRLHWIERHTWAKRQAAETLQRLARNAEQGQTITVVAQLIEELERPTPLPGNP